MESMKKLHRKGTVHPSPAPIILSDQQLSSFLPATILTLTVALSPKEREVLVYLISSRKATVVDGHDHPPLFHCSCFRCYMSYWVRWDSSPNHQLIHQIIDAFEDHSLPSSQTTTRNNNNNNKRGSKSKSRHLKTSSSSSSSSQHSDSDQPQPVQGESSSVDEGGDRVEDDQKGSVRRFVSFIGERIWGASVQ